jgi:hypothetical protein
MPEFKGVVYESYAALRTHLVLFEWPLVELYNKGAKVDEDVKKALDLKIKESNVLIEPDESAQITTKDAPRSEGTPASEININVHTDSNDST